ncbi:protein LAZY 1-like [Phragmites australis]|uniref:protein LAZY 1-like n=1 Tax=Phragmites australis TaxID=29695 RepID=UPI002D78271A|nr:protein LAZY 1-like [Phragmites australis]
MKLLGWMHRKLRSNNDVFKDFSTGGGGTCKCITGLASPDPITFLTSANEYFADDAFATNHPSPPATDHFNFGGSDLLTIGTLGIAAVAVPGDDDDDYYCKVDVDVDADLDNNGGTHSEEGVDGGAVTPIFTYPTAPETDSDEKSVAAVEAIAEKDDYTTTEDDLMVVSAELEKVLGGRNSCAAGDMVASARVSFAMGVDCPLQGFLFGSPVSDAESRLEQPRDSSGGRRTSLGELFMRTRFADDKVSLGALEEGEDGAAGGEREEGKACKGGGSGGHKAMKKRKVKDEKGASGDGAPASATVTKIKFQKILRIFHRKVYPESTALARSLTKKYRKRGSSADEPEPPASPKLRCRKNQGVPGFGCCANSASFAGAASPDDGEHNVGSKSGHWIRTDADYLVLEL